MSLSSVFQNKKKIVNCKPVYCWRDFMKNWSQAWFHVLNWESSHWLRSDFRCTIATFIIINGNHINHHHRHHEYRSEHWASHRCANFLRLCVGEHCCEQPGIFSSFIFWDFFIFLPLYIDIVVNCLMAMTMCNCICRTFGVLVSYLLYLTFLFKISLQSWNFDFGHF